MDLFPAIPTGEGEKETVKEGRQIVGRGGGRPWSGNATVGHFLFIKKLHLWFSSQLWSQILSKDILMARTDSYTIFSVTSSNKQCTNRPWSCLQSWKSRGRNGKQKKCMKGKLRLNLQNQNVEKSPFTLSWFFSFCSISGKGPERRKSKQQKKQSATESGRKILRFVSSPTRLANLMSFRLCKSPFFITRTVCQETRDGRVDSWRTFQAKGKKHKEKKNRTFLKPPKVKMEQREWCSETGLTSTPPTQTWALCIFTPASCKAAFVKRHIINITRIFVILPTCSSRPWQNLVLYSGFSNVNICDLRLKIIHVSCENRKKISSSSLPEDLCFLFFKWNKAWTYKPTVAVVFKIFTYWFQLHLHGSNVRTYFPIWLSVNKTSCRGCNHN